MNDTTKRSRPPASRGGSDTRAQLLASARELFGRHGYDGTSVRAITTAAGANLGAITYHFGSKEALYHEVLERALAPLVERIRIGVESEGTALERCEAVTRGFMDQLQRTPDVPHLLTQEMAQGRPPPPPVVRALRANAERMTRLMTEGQREGTLRAGEPMLLTLSLLAQPIYFSLVRHPMRAVLGIDQTDPDALGRVTDHIVAFTRAGLTAAEETP